MASTSTSPAIALVGLPGLSAPLRAGGYVLLAEGSTDPAAVAAAAREAASAGRPYVAIVAGPDPTVRAWAGVQSTQGRRVLWLRSEAHPSGDPPKGARSIDLPASVDQIMAVFGAPPVGGVVGTAMVGVDGSTRPAHEHLRLIRGGVSPEEGGDADDGVGETPVETRIAVGGHFTPAPTTAQAPPAAAPPRPIEPEVDPWGEPEPELVPAPGDDPWGEPEPLIAAERPALPEPSVEATWDEPEQVPGPGRAWEPQAQATIEATPTASAPAIEPSWSEPSPEPVPQPAPEVVPQPPPEPAAAASPWESDAGQWASPPPRAAEARPEPIAVDPFVRALPPERPRATTGGAKRPTSLAPVIVCFAGKGGCGKSSLSLALAQRAAVVGGMERVVAVDANRGQGDVRKYLRVGHAALPSVFDAAISGDPRRAVTMPDRLNQARNPSLPRLDLAVVLAPGDTQVDPGLIDAGVYSRVLATVREVADLVVVDTQIVEAYDTSNLIDAFVVPLLSADGWGLGLSDSSMPGVDNLLRRLRTFGARGVGSARLMFGLNRVDPGSVLDVEAMRKLVSPYATYVGAVPNRSEIATAFETGHIPHDEADLAEMLDSILYRVTGQAVFDPARHEAARQKQKPKRAGLFRRRR